MKNFNFKSFFAGLLIGTIGISTVFAATEIKSATFASSKVYFNNQELLLKNSLVSIVQEGSSDAQLYMPVREILEYFNFNVDWDKKTNSINLTMFGNNNNGKMIGMEDYENIISSNHNYNDIDKTAIDLIIRTGNWQLVENHLHNMTSDGIQTVVDIYNSKHTDNSKHKNAHDYINKH